MEKKETIGIYEDKKNSSSTVNEYRNYVQWVFGFVGFVIISITVLLYLVDPIDIWGTPRLNGVTHYKSGKGDYAEISKIYEVARLRPEEIYIGNSRIYNGFPMEASKREYNLAFNGISLKEMRQCLNFVYSVYHPKRVFVGLETMQFIGRPAPIRDTLSDERLKKIAMGTPTRELMAIWEGIRVSKKLPETIIESIRHSNEVSPYELGWNGEIGKARQVNREEYYHTITGFRGAYENGNSNIEDTVNCLYGILDDAKENDVEVVLFFSPISIDLQALQDITGISDKARDIKREIASVHPIYDFAWASWLTQNREDFYTDASHYNSRTGELMKEALHGEHSDIVQLLTADNSAEKLRDEYQKYMDWRNLNLEYIVQLKNVSKGYITPGSLSQYIGF